MAGRKKNDNSAGAVILFLGFIVLLVLVSIAPIFILLYGVFYSFKLYMGYQKITKTYSDFWLNESEKSQYLSSVSTWLQYENEINELESLATQNRISVNANGKYSRKSKVGKQVQGRLDEIVPIWEDVKKTKEHFECLPYKRWIQFHAGVPKAIGGIFGFTIWLLVFEYLCADYNLDAAQLFRDYSNFLFSEAGNIVFGLSGLAAIVGFLLIKWIVGLFSNGLYSPEPPLVNPVNVNEY